MHGGSRADRAMGLFINTLPVRIRLGEASVRESIRRTHASLSQLVWHEHAPLALAQRCSALPSSTPLFSALLNYRHSTLELDNVSDAGLGDGIEVLAAQERHNYPLSLSVDDLGQDFHLGLQIASPMDAQRMCEYMHRVLEQAVQALERTAETPAWRVGVLAQAERTQLLERWGAARTAYAQTECVHELFERQAARTPDAVAVVQDGRHTRYRQLNEAANRLARHLRSLGVRAGDSVAIVLERSVDLVAAQIAILKCGACYVPIDQNAPIERQAFLLQDSAAAVLITRSGETLPPLGRSRRLDLDLADLHALAADDLGASVDSEATAYIMYTSGSTGQPKGVMVPHRAIGRVVRDNGYAPFDAGDRVAFASNPAFDATTMEVWGALLNGGRLVVIAADVLLEPERLAQALSEQQVTAMFVTTALFNQYVLAIPRALAGLRYLMCGGERADPDKFARLLAHEGPRHLIHCYGPTETTTFATTCEIGRVPESMSNVPIGGPIAGTSVYVLDAHGEPVPQGVAGELYIGGVGVALGYLNRPELTAERFLDDPFANRAGARMYRTGDLGRWLADGTIEFLGRNDHQVKIRGFRIELGEIEACLTQQPGVREAIVLAREDNPGDKRLVAYVVGDALPHSAELRAALAQELPEYMVPAAFVALQRLPLTPNGKLDRRALPAPDGDAYAQRTFEEPQGEVETALAQIWAELLQVERVGRGDHFFELGGHSLLAVQMSSRVRQQLGLEVALSDLFAQPVLHEFAALTHQAASGAQPALQPQSRPQVVPLSFAQQRMWLIAQMGAHASVAYHIPGGLRLQGPLDVDALQAALDRIVQRHESLRTHFAVVDGQPTQRLSEAAGFSLIRQDMTQADDAQAEVEYWSEVEAEEPFDLGTGPLVRGRLLRLGEQEHVLLLTMHHIVSDGWSMGVLIHELGVLYRAYAADGVAHAVDPLPPLPLQYADYAVAQRQWLDAGTESRHLDYWRSHLAGAPAMSSLPTDKPRPAEQNFKGGMVEAWLPADASKALADLARREHATPFMVLTAALSVMLSRYNAQTDICLGTVVANRDRAEFEPMIGLFLDTLAIRTRIDPQQRFEELLRQVRANLLGAYAHQGLPFEQVLDVVKPARKAGVPPLFQVMLLMQNMPMEHLQLAGLSMQALPPPEHTAKFDLTLYVTERDGALHLAYEYSQALFREETIERLAGHFNQLLTELSRAPATRIDDLSLPGTHALALPATAASRSDSGERIALSHHQQRLWFIDAFETGKVYQTSPVYHNVPLLLQFDAGVLAEHIEAALNAVIARHDALRTSIRSDGTQAWQQVDRDGSLTLSRVTVEGEDLLEAALADASRPFALGRDRLLRATLWRGDGADALLCVTAHHIVADRPSMQALARELVQACAALVEGRSPDLPATGLQFGDYAHWQAAQTPEFIEAGLLYWKQQLHDRLQALELPLNRPRPAVHTFTAARHAFALDGELASRLRALADTRGVSVEDVLLTGFNAFLRRYAGHDELVIGTGAAGRGHAGFEALVGPVANLLVLRTKLPAHCSFERLLQSLAHTRRRALQHQDMPFELLTRKLDPEKDMSRTALFDVLFQYDEDSGRPIRAGAVQALPLETNLGYGKYDLHLHQFPAGDGFQARVAYNADFFDAWLIEQMMRHYVRLLRAAVDDPAAIIDEVPLLEESEQQTLLAWNQTDAAYPHDKTVTRLFEEQAARTPDGIAVSCGDVRLSYRELNQQANRLAHYLRARGALAQERVALCLDRGVEMIVAMLAVIKAGAAYVPIDPEYPQDRVRFMLEDAGCRFVLTSAERAASLPDTAAQAIVLDRDREAVDAQPSSDPAPLNAPDDLLYVIYTSGSTGRPKGTLLSHRNVVRLMINDRLQFDFSERDVWSMFHSYAFDFTVWEIYGALLYGGRLVIVPHAERKDPQRFLELLQREQVTVLNQTPSAFYHLADIAVRRGEPALAALRYVIFGGEALSPSRLREFRAVHPRVELINMYGITETCVHVTFKRLEAADLESGACNIGAPIPTTRTYILDSHQRLLPAGMPGELYVGGLGVGQGYLNRDELTRQRFIADPYRPGERLYRSGDLAKRLDSGEMIYLGRIDNQVQLRGFRVELGEIEAQLARLPGVREAAVTAREDQPGDQRLVAYLVGDEVPDTPELRAALARELPDYMVPAAYVMLARLPLTSNGKLDRDALPAPEGDAYAQRAYEEPQGPVETALAQIWAELLQVERVGRQDHFFELGGHSLLALQMTARLQQRLGLDVALSDLFAQPVLQHFARVAGHKHGEALPAIVAAPRSQALPLSFAQQRLWFIAQMDQAASAAYHMAGGLRLHGPLDVDALQASLDRIVQRHEALRTRFELVDGQPLQRIDADGRFNLLRHDLSDAADAAAQVAHWSETEAAAPFDLAAGPLARGRLLRLGEQEHVLLLTLHHIVSDGWSMGVLVNELGALYRAYALEGVATRIDPLPALPVQYADYALWQRQWLSGEVQLKQQTFWREQLSGAPALITLPTDRPRPAVQEYAGASLDLELDDDLSDALRALSRKHGTTLYMILLAAWSALASRLAGQDEVVIGTPVANRSRVEVEPLIGFFVNTLALRLDLQGKPTVAELLARVRERVLQAQAHQDVPFEQVVEVLKPARSMAHSPLFQLMFSWQNTPQAALELGALQLRDLDAGEHRSAQFDLSLGMQEVDGRIVGSLEYATALFDRDTMLRHVDYLKAVLRGMAEDDSQAVERIAILDAGERQRVLQTWNDTARAYPQLQCIHRLFEQQAAQTPDAVAVEQDGQSLTYAELNARSNRLAHHLKALGVGADDRVAVAMPRTPDMLVALLATLKAGGAYVPLDLAYPSERLGYMLEDSAPKVLLTHGEVRANLPAVDGLKVIEIDRDASAWQSLPQHDLDAQVSPVGAEHLAYVIYTSGSTGQPKGVMVEHRTLSNFLLSMQEQPGLERGDRLLAVTTLSFDIAGLELWLPLISGASIVLAHREQAMDGAALKELLESRAATILQATPATWRLLIEAGWQGGEGFKALIGGEALPPDLAAELLQRCGQLWNMYGPTETTVWSMLDRVRPASPPAGIGRPIANTSIYVLDAHGEPVPQGVAGELYIGGDGVARGYLNRAQLTGERFLDDPFANRIGARMYRTGDLGRWLADGTIEFLGRNDHQVKIRGFRIELGEIEACLIRQGGVREAVVLAREDRPGDKRLVAYLVGDDIAQTAQLRAALAQELPDYMVPAAYVTLGRLPLTPNGKIDRRALPAPEGDAYAQREFEAPQGPVETTLAQIWAELLQVERVGRQDHFFELGGHSLLAVQMGSRLRERLGMDVPLSALFFEPVLSAFARHVSQAAVNVLPPLVSGQRPELIPLSFAQQRLWFIAQMGQQSSGAYHMAGGLRLRGALDESALQAALDRIVQRHEALRTHFELVEGQPVQRIARQASFALARQDLSASADPAAELAQCSHREAHEPFHLDRGPLIRGRLLRLAEQEHVLLLTMHHIVSDGWSMGVLINELGELYRAYASHEVPADIDPLPALPAQYADYAVWQRRWLDGELLQSQQAYWCEHLQGAPGLLELPTDRARPPVQEHAGESRRFLVDADITRDLRALSQRHGTTLYMTLLASWAALLSRLSGQDDVVIGTPMVNRNHTELEPLIGLFINNVALRFDLSGDPSVAEFLAQVRGTALAAQSNKDLPFEQVVEALKPVRSLAYTPLYQVVFVMHNMADAGLSLPGLQIEAMPVEEATAQNDLWWSVTEMDERLECEVVFATALFDAATIERWIGHWQMLLRAMVAEEATQVSRLPLLSSDDRRQLLRDWNDTAQAAPEPASPEYAAREQDLIHTWFEAQAARAGDAPALVSEHGNLSYAELNAQANRLAHHLVALGVRPDQRVALLLERGPQLVVAMLATLKAGGAYLPLDPQYPSERLAFMLDDSRPKVVLTQQSLEEQLPASRALMTASVVLVDDSSASWQRLSDADPDPAALGIGAATLAYVIYTSGSTGKPKGVMVEHGGLAHYLGWALGHYADGGRRDAVVSSPVAFDATVTSLYLPLISGGVAHLLRDGDELVGLENWIRGAAAGHLIKITPSHLRALGERLEELGAGCARQLFVIGGEALPASTVALWRRISPDSRLVNEYGPTETVVGCVVHEASAGVDDSGYCPIGRPIANTRIYILDAHGEPVPAGVSGEIYIAGAGVTRGYHNRAELTAERFLRDPFADDAQARMYRSGDIGRWLPGGVIDYQGRNDDQVKIRGFRIELGEIEAKLAQCFGVREAVVAAREDLPGSKRLVAYYVAADASVDSNALRTQLQLSLPDYMVPAAYVALERLPLTPNGKLDRRALPAPEGDAFGQRVFEEPLGPVETALAQIWSELLRVERVGRQDQFFELGGHSLMALQMTARLRQRLGLDVALPELFAHPVLRDFARVAGQRQGEALPAIVAAERTQALPLSFAQQRLWFITQMDQAASAAYHIAGGMRLHGPLDVEALQAALDRIAQRHEALRTRFEVIDGQPVQKIDGHGRFSLLRQDLRGADDVEAQVTHWSRIEVEAPFDMAAGPLARGRLLQAGEQDHVLLLTLHHIVSDGWSMGVLVQELSALYRAYALDGVPTHTDPLPALPVQYADYALWQRQWLSGEVQQKQQAYWRDLLTGAPALITLPTDRPRPAVQEYAGASLDLELDDGLSEALRALSRKHGTTLYMTLLAAWSALASRLAGQDEVVIGTPVANRSRVEVEPLIGFFVNTLALRLDLSGEPTVSELLARVREQVLQAQAHQNVPFEQVVEVLKPARSMAHSPLFQLMFTWQNTPQSSLELGALQLRDLDGGERRSAQFDLSLGMQEIDGRIVGNLEYATSLFDHATMARHAEYLKAVLRGMAADDSQPVERIAILEAYERRQVLQTWNDTARAYPPVQAIHHLFEQQVARTPDAVAVAQDGQWLSYAELNAQSNRLARHLRTLGVGADERVAIAMPRSLEMMVGLLAVLKAGGAYMPLDPAYPSERLAYMLEDSAPKVLLTHSEVRADLPIGDGLTVIELDRDAAAWRSLPDTDADATDVSANQLAYVIYTSGSTGQPKGVMNEHGGVVNRLQWMQEAYALSGDDAVLQKTPSSFDVSVWEFFWPLMTGARLVMARPEGHKDPRYLAEVIRDQRITTMHFVPSMLQVFLDVADTALCASLTRVMCSGEALPGALARRFRQSLPGVGLYNLYGPTEAAVDVTAWSCDHDALPENIPIGRPIANTAIYLLDRHGEPVPAGTAGELFIGGVQVARGYLNRPQLTGERFLADPFSDRPDARMYKTGDLARWQDDGTLLYLGRNDHQVKIRGQRIELGEIEAQLAKLPGVREAVVLAREDRPGDKRLVAYVVGEHAPQTAQLRAALSRELPEYMVPAACVVLQALPLTPNGKLDRQALPAPEGEAYAQRPYEAPQGETEIALAQIWSELLQVEQVGRHDSFFDLGGHSLMVIHVVDRLRKLGFEVEIRTIVETPALQDVASRTHRVARAPLSKHLVPIRFGAARRPLFFIHEPTGEVLSYERLSRHLDDDLPVYGLQADRSDAEGHITAEMLARRYVQAIRSVQPSGPYRLAGWSGGGHLAYEMAQQLLGEDESVEFLGMIDSGRPGNLRPEDMPQDEERFRWDFLFSHIRYLDPSLDEDEVEALESRGTLEAAMAHCRSIGWLPPSFSAEELSWRAALMKQLSVACLSYRPQLLPMPTYLFTADIAAGKDTSHGWAELAGDYLRLEVIGGTHKSIMEEPRVGKLAARISALLAQAEAEPTPPPSHPHKAGIVIQSAKPGTSPVFCIPGAGANVSCFLSLAQACGSQLPLTGLQSRGHDGKSVPHASVEAAARALLPEIRAMGAGGPYHLLGHSFGGWIAFELACLLERAGEPVAPLILVDCEPPQRVRVSNHLEVLTQFVDLLEMDQARDLGLSAKTLAALDPRQQDQRLLACMVDAGLLPPRTSLPQLQALLRVFTANLNASYQPAAVYAGPVVLLNAQASDKPLSVQRSLMSPAEQAEGWHRYAKNLDIHALHGDHMSVLRFPHVNQLAAVLAKAWPLHVVSAAGKHDTTAQPAKDHSIKVEST
jgi:amino acid adenylation domain-containing protein